MKVYAPLTAFAVLQLLALTNGHIFPDFSMKSGLAASIKRQQRNQGQGAILAEAENEGNAGINFNDLKRDPKDYDINFCDIERRPWISKEEFDRDYRDKKPLILTNVTDAWRGKGIAFSRESLIQNYGDMIVNCGFSAQFPLQGGSGYEKLTIGDYFEYLNDKDLRDLTIDEPLYFFDRGDFFKNAPHLKQEVILPQSFQWFQDFWKSYFFGYGASLTGVQFHKHGNAYAVVIEGRKRWLVYPPERVPPFDYMSHKTMIDWIDEKLPQLEENYKPLQCVQEAGEIAYIPEDWYHAVLNLEDTSVISGQIGARGSYAAHMDDVMDGLRQQISVNPDDGFQKALYVLQKNPDYEELAMIVAKAAKDNEDYENCVKYSDYALQLHPYLSKPHVYRGECLAGMNKIDEAIESVGKALALNEDDPYTYAVLAQLHLARNEDDRANELFQQQHQVNQFRHTYLDQLNEKQNIIKSVLQDKRAGRQSNLKEIKERTLQEVEAAKHPSHRAGPNAAARILNAKRQEHRERLKEAKESLRKAREQQS